MQTNSNNSNDSNAPAASESPVAAEATPTASTSTPASPSNTMNKSSSSNNIDSPRNNNGINLKSMVALQIPKAQLMHEGSEDHCIFLPHQATPVNHLALDIGGSLVKLVYYEPEDVHYGHFLPPKSPIAIKKPWNANNSQFLSSALGANNTSKNQQAQQQQQQQASKEEDQNDDEDSNNGPIVTEQKTSGGRICFARFRTNNIEECISFISGTCISLLVKS